MPHDGLVKPTLMNCGNKHTFPLALFGCCPHCKLVHELSPHVYCYVIAIEPFNLAPKYPIYQWFRLKQFYSKQEKQTRLWQYGTYSKNAGFIPKFANELQLAFAKVFHHC